jgi:hypothetical protein
MATWPAVVLASRGTWMGPARSAALAAAAFAPAALAAYLANLVSSKPTEVTDAR